MSETRDKAMKEANDGLSFEQLLSLQIPQEVH